MKLPTLAVTVIFAAASAIAAPITFQANLTGAAENPPNSSAGTGTAIVVIDPAADFMSVGVTFSGLTGNTTASHIHCCVAPPGTANVATAVPTFPGFPLGVMSGTYAQTFDMSLASSYNPSFVSSFSSLSEAEAALFEGIMNGTAYLNIHSDFAPSGEIRGFLAPAAAVPEPATVVITAAALAGLALLRRRRAA